MGKTDLSDILNLDDLNEAPSKQWRVIDEDRSPRSKNKAEKLEAQSQPVKKQKMDTQDRLMTTQIIIALLLLAAVVVIRYFIPELYQTLQAQYVDFVTPPPEWDLGNLWPSGQRVVGIALQWIGYAAM